MYDGYFEALRCGKYVQQSQKTKGKKRSYIICTSIFRNIKVHQRLNRRASTVYSESESNFRRIGMMVFTHIRYPNSRHR